MPNVAAEPDNDTENFPVSPDDRLFLALEDDSNQAATKPAKPWKIMVVDDEDQVHSVTRLALSDFSFAGRPLEFIDVYSGAEAKKAIQEHPDTAIILLDVVMETDDAGLEVARYVRQELSNHFVRIILRTGQPGMAPERRVLKVYDINDYRAKTELTQERMFTVIYTALSSYRDLIALARSRHRLMGMVDELEQFAQVASTDLQGPLADLVGQIQFLSRSAKDKLDEEARHCLEKMWHSAQSLESAVNDLLTVADIGGKNESRSLIDCETVVTEACNSLEEMISKRKAVIRHENLPSVYGNHRQLVQLFHNLIANAIKFQPGENPEVDISVTTQGRDWLFSVTDKGSGIEPQHQENIFKLLRKYHADTDQDGSGIGLAICEKVVRWHGGQIWVESTPGQGSTFYFTLPLSE